MSRRTIINEDLIPYSTEDLKKRKAKHEEALKARQEALRASQEVEENRLQALVAALNGKALSPSERAAMDYFVKHKQIGRLVVLLGEVR